MSDNLDVNRVLDALRTGYVQAGTYFWGLSTLEWFALISTISTVWTAYLAWCYRRELRSFIASLKGRKD